MKARPFTIKKDPNGAPINTAEGVSLLEFQPDWADKPIKIMLNSSIAQPYSCSEDSNNYVGQIKGTDNLAGDIQSMLQSLLENNVGIDGSPGKFFEVSSNSQAGPTEDTSVFFKIDEGGFENSHQKSSQTLGILHQLAEVIKRRSDGRLFPGSLVAVDPTGTAVSTVGVVVDVLMDIVSVVKENEIAINALKAEDLFYARVVGPDNPTVYDGGAPDTASFDGTIDGSGW